MNQRQYSRTMIEWPSWCKQEGHHFLEGIPFIGSQRKIVHMTNQVLIHRTYEGFTAEWHTLHIAPEVAYSFTQSIWSAQAEFCNWPNALYYPMDRAAILFGLIPGAPFDIEDAIASVYRSLGVEKTGTDIGTFWESSLQWTIGECYSFLSSTYCEDKGNRISNCQLHFKPKTTKTKINVIVFLFLCIAFIVGQRNTIAPHCKHAEFGLSFEKNRQPRKVEGFSKCLNFEHTHLPDSENEMESECFDNTNEKRNTAANELFSLSELPDGVVGDLARMFRSPDEDEVWRDYCLQFLGSALEREDGVTDEDRALARETLVEALASTNATFAGTALRALHRGDPSDPLVASNALRIARDPSYPSSSRTTALLILEDCVRATASTASTTSTASTLTETASAISSDPSASSLLRRTAEAVQKRSSVQSHDQWNDQGGSQ